MPHLLDGVRELEDLTVLVRAAGHTIGFQELAPDQWGLTPAPGRAALLGRHHGFEWLGFQSLQAARLATTLARRLARRGRLACLAVLDPASRVVALSVSLDPRPLLLVELDRPSPLASHCLARLRGATADGALGAAVHIASALDADAVGRAFFDRFRTVLAAAMEALPSRMPIADRHAAALLQLTRLLFLHFVQAKGWLDGRPRFLREELDRALAARRPVQRQLMAPLFFGTLNQPWASRTAARRFGRVPFLNGGLFQPHPLEREWPVEWPDELWRRAFDDLFERFHFVATEAGDPQGIAPDMLGRVFEGVMDPDERGASGTFYTPMPIVRALVTDALASYLTRRLRCGDAEAERRLHDPDRETQDALDRVRLLDPAVGSGAFLLGALELLTAASGGAVPARRRVMTTCLHGVDLNPVAVRLAELRLWVAVIEADPATTPESVRPLPNLDGVIRQGDSLTDPCLRTWRPAGPDALVRRIARLQTGLSQARGTEKRRILKALRAAEQELADRALTQALETAAARVADLASAGRSATLFGQPGGLGAAARDALEALRLERRGLWAARRRLRRDGHLPWFHYPSQFADVFAAGGFDIVVGNPPWVRAESLEASRRRQLASRYRWWAPIGRAGFAHQPDLSVAFLERAMELTAPGGTVAMLVPSKLATAQYATRARAELATRTTLRTVADLTDDPRAGFDATTYPMAVVAVREPAPAGHRIRSELATRGGCTVPQGRLGGGPWVLVPDRIARALERLQADHPRLGDHLRCHLGAKTGLNRVFLDPGDALEPELLWWAVRGRDIRPFAAEPARRLLWPHDSAGLPLQSLPPAARAYLARHRAALERRADWSGGPWWSLFRAGPAVAPHRVVWADLSPGLEAVALSAPEVGRMIPLNTCYVAPVGDGRQADCLAAWLNSTWIRVAAMARASRASGGFHRFTASVVAQLPLPREALTNRDLANLGQSGRAGTISQDDLDDACNRLLGLGPDDRAALATKVPARRRHRR